MSSLEVLANVLATLSIALAARNSVHTWITGIAGCAAFAVVFFGNQLYADVTLQVFFILTSAIGWWNWQHGADQTGRSARCITRASPATLGGMFAIAVVAMGLYGFLLNRFTNAYLPYADSAVLACSVLAQCLLMWRKLETWPVWLLVNTISVPLFASRGLWLTAALYMAYWFNAWYGWWRWDKDRVQPFSPATHS